MSKFLQNFLRTLVMIVAMVGASTTVLAQEVVTFSQSNLVTLHDQGTTQLNNGSITLSIDKGDKTVRPDGTTALKFQVGTKMTISGSAITKVEITTRDGNKGYFDASVETISELSSNKQTWTGKASSISFTNNSVENAYVTEVKVTTSTYTLSFGQASATAVIGGNFALPTLSIQKDDADFTANTDGIELWYNLYDANNTETGITTDKSGSESVKIDNATGTSLTQRSGVLTLGSTTGQVYAMARLYDTSNNNNVVAQTSLPITIINAIDNSNAAWPYPHTWDFSNADWEESASQLNLYAGQSAATWASWGETGKEWVVDVPETATAYNVDVISRLKFIDSNGASSTLGIILDQNENQLFLSPGVNVVIPSVPANYRVQVTYSDGTITGYTSGTPVTISEAGDVTLPIASDCHIQKIEVLAPEETAQGVWTYSQVDQTEEHNTQYKMTIGLDIAGKTEGVFTNPGVCEDLPGLKFSFGNPDTEWKVVTETRYLKALSLSATTAVKTKDKIPTEGSFLKFEPKVNGFITVYMVDWNDGNKTPPTIIRDGVTITPTKTQISSKVAEYSFMVAGGRTYYLYSNPNSSNGWFQLEIRSITFEPSFLTRDDSKYERFLSGNAVNGDDGLKIGTPAAVPFISMSAKKTDGLTISRNPEKESNYVVSSINGQTTINGATTKQLTVTATIKNANKIAAFNSGNDVTQSYIIKKVTMPDNVWMVSSSNKPGVNTEASVDGMKLTFGGWMLKETVTNGQTKDPVVREEKWSVGSGIDAAANNDESQKTFIIDGLAYTASGNNDAKSETLNNESNKFGQVNGVFTVGDRNSLPVRGAYVYFEPTKPGTLSVYMLQNGAINTFTFTDAQAEATDLRTGIDKYEKRTENEEDVWYAHSKETGWWGKNAKPTGKISWRPFYIVDEFGQNVTGVKSYTRSALNQSLTEIENIGRNQTEPFAGGEDGTHIFYDQINEDDENGFNDMAEARINLIKNWYSDKADGDPVEVITTSDGGYIVTQKSFVRYTFDVQPGKTYYLFSNSSKLGLCGYSFTPSSAPTGNYELANKADDNPTDADVTYEKATFKGRKFTAGQWTTICLPFSVTRSQIRKTFGDDTQMLEVYDAKNKTINMVRHVNDQIIAAGVPYLIRPSKGYAGTEDNEAVIEDGIWFPSTAVAAASTTPFDSEYWWTGTYKSFELKSGDYFVSGKDGNFKYYDTDNHDSYSYRAFLLTDHTSGAKPALFTSIAYGNASDSSEDGNTTGIQTITAEQTEGMIIVEDGSVYNLNGQCVATSAADINSLPAGVYIMNGKKIVIK